MLIKEKKFALILVDLIYEREECIIKEEMELTTNLLTFKVYLLILNVFFKQISNNTVIPSLFMADSY